MSVREELLHFIWKHKNEFINSFLADKLEGVEVISPGEHNVNAGPDFFNAKVKIDNVIWAGNVEMHINASDWYRHGHDNNPAYDSVILHLVANDDKQTITNSGREVKTIVVSIPEELEREFSGLMQSTGWIPCFKHIKEYNPLSLSMWLSSLAVERLEQKTEHVLGLVNDYNGSWEEAFYVSMARSFGLKINAQPFEMLAKATPMKVLAKVKDNILSVEAILFGQAGMLEDSNAEDDADEYKMALQKEYRYQKEKFGLNPIPYHLWKFMRLRPPSFPTIRIAQFTQLICKSSGLFSRCMESTDLKQLSIALRVGCSTYWDKHYTFSKESPYRRKMLGSSMVSTILINTIIPFMFAYGTYRGNQQLRDRALSILESVKPEKNSIVDEFEKLGVKAQSAFTTQALVHLKGQYCNHKKCLYCQVGANALLKKLE